MASFDFYGSGNTVSDPQRELAGVLSRMAQVECREDVHYLDTDSSRYERGLALVLRSVEIRASRWLPKEIFDSIKNYTQENTVLDADNNQGASSLDQPVLLNAEQCRNVPTKILHILADNYGLAARCVRRQIKSTNGDMYLDTNPGRFDPVESAKVVRLYQKYDHVKSQLCSVLSAMGESCSRNSDTKFLPASPRDHPVSDQSKDLHSADIKPTIMKRETTKLKLKRKRKVA